MREDDVGRRLASSPEALLRQEVAGQIIPVARKAVANVVGSGLSDLISPEPLSLSTGIRVTGLSPEVAVRLHEDERGRQVRVHPFAES